ncbi:hypothetical protein [Fortiea contorta]|uniref:hypothetical protein n=1 Tax=Fortiea contorta TaxID=1892405 RepID=UPI00034DCA8E|nr:hypothetical protein [Fortiea contorta]
MTNAEQPQFQIPNQTELGLEMGPRDYSPTPSPPDSQIESIIQRHEANLLAIPGVVMISHRIVEPKKEAIIVGVINATVLNRLPNQLEGVPVRGEVTGQIDAL